MPVSPSSVQDLWSSAWVPSDNSLRHHGQVIDAAVSDLSGLRTATTEHLEEARRNLRSFVVYLDGLVLRGDWARSKAVRFSVELSLQTLGVLATLGGPITWIGAIGLVGSLSLFLVDVGDLALKATAQDRVRDLIDKIDALEQVIRFELEDRSKRMIVIPTSPVPAPK